MKRLLSLVLVLIFGLPLIAPLIAPALALGGEAGVPACCRRGGAHHCMGATQTETGAALRAPKCPAYPAAVVQGRHGDVGFVVGALRGVRVVSQPTLTARAMARARVAREKARGMRGPPVEQKA